MFGGQSVLAGWNWRDRTLNVSAPPPLLSGPSIAPPNGVPGNGSPLEPPVPDNVKPDESVSRAGGDPIGPRLRGLAGFVHSVSKRAWALPLC